MKNWLFWGAALRFVFESYLELSLCIFIGLINMKWSYDDFSTGYNNVLNLAFMAVVFVMPLFTSIFYGRNIDKMDDEEFKKKFGTLYEGLNLDMEEGKREAGPRVGTF